MVVAWWKRGEHECWGGGEHIRAGRDGLGCVGINARETAVAGLEAGVGDEVGRCGVNGLCGQRVGYRPCDNGSRIEEVGVVEARGWRPCEPEVGPRDISLQECGIAHIADNQVGAGADGDGALGSERVFRKKQAEK